MYPYPIQYSQSDFAVKVGQGRVGRVRLGLVRFGSVGLGLVGRRVPFVLDM